MKNILYILVFALLSQGCKRSNVEEPTNLKDAEVSFGVSKSNASGEEVFTEGDVMGVYMIEKSNAAAFKEFKSKNYGYELSGGRWSAVDENEILKWRDNDPAYYFYGFSPRAVEGSAIEMAKLPLGAPADTAVKYVLPLDQSSQVFEDVDLMRFVNTGVNGEGVTMKSQDGKSVGFKFYHMLSKIRFNIFATRYADLVVPSGKVYLTGVRVVSSDVAQSGFMSLKNGSITMVAPKDVNTWVWAGRQEMELYDLNVPSPNMVGIEFLVSPFVATYNGTRFEFDLEYTDKDSQVKTFVCRYVVPADGKINFVSGKKSVFNTEISISNENIVIEAGIVGWTEENFTIKPIG